MEADNIDLAPGLGLLQGAIVDQHFVVRSRYNRLLTAVIEFPEVLGIGIDESTAILVEGDRGQGRGRLAGRRGSQHGALGGATGREARRPPPGPERLPAGRVVSFGVSIERRPRTESGYTVGLAGDATRQSPPCKRSRRDGFAPLARTNRKGSAGLGMTCQGCTDDPENPYYLTRRGAA